jgi:hypothetical protein
MGTALEKLASIGGDAISPSTDTFDSIFTPFANPSFGGLRTLLNAKNGFYAFESALHVYPAQRHGSQLGLVEWNAPDLWISQYDGIADGCLFFAEDIFGGQFCVNHDGICSFDPETGKLQQIASDIEGWAHALLQDFEFLTGHPIAHAWQEANGMLQAGLRLVPKVPFVAGGSYQIENLYELDAVKAMRARANLATQIRHLPDGANITWKIVD